MGTLSSFSYPALKLRKSNISQVRGQRPVEIVEGHETDKELDISHTRTELVETQNGTKKE